MVGARIPAEGVPGVDAVERAERVGELWPRFGRGSLRDMTGSEVQSVTATEALARLRQGNARFVDESPQRVAIGGERLRRDLLAGQAPFAVILGCSDSRVPAEIVFDQSLGDLFVIRVAGNIVAPSQVGSIEFAADRFGTPLVVVLGHTGCGAVSATIEELERPSGGGSPNLGSIVARIRPTVESLRETELVEDPARLAAAAVRANVRASADHLRHGSALLEELVEAGRLRVVGAEYCLESGVVDFFDGV